MDANKIKELKEIAARFMGFGKDKPAPVNTPAKFEAFKIKGSEDTVEYNPTLEKGSDVMHSSGTGSIPALDGKYELENGVCFTTKDGKIESVENDGSVPDDDVVEDDKPTLEKMAAVLIAFEALKVEFAEVKTKLETYEAAAAKVPTEAVIAKFNEDVQLIGQAIQELADMPFETVAAKVEGVDEARNENYEAVASKFMGDQV